MRCSAMAVRQPIVKPFDKICIGSVVQTVFDSRILADCPQHSCAACRSLHCLDAPGRRSAICHLSQRVFIGHLRTRMMESRKLRTPSDMPSVTGHRLFCRGAHSPCRNHKGGPHTESTSISSHSHRCPAGHQRHAQPQAQRDRQDEAVAPCEAINADDLQSDVGGSGTHANVHRVCFHRQVVVRSEAGLQLQHSAVELTGVGVQLQEGRLDRP
jgi:hypothetical protein